MMLRSKRTLVTAGSAMAYLLALAPLAEAGTPPTATIQIVPVPAKVGSYPPGTTIVGRELQAPVGGFRAWFEAQLFDWDPNADNIPSLCAYQLGVNSAGFLDSDAPGEQPDLSWAYVPCESNAECVDAFGEPHAKCNHPVCGTNLCDFAYSDTSGTSRPADSWCAPLGCDFALCQCPQVMNNRCGGIYRFPPCDRPDDGITYYLATLVLDVPPCTTGRYVVGLSPNDTFLSDSDSNHIPILNELGFSINIFSNDCNANEVPDQCDIAAGDSFDCNINGIPDECENPDPDCPAELVLFDVNSGGEFSSAVTATASVTYTLVGSTAQHGGVGLMQSADYEMANGFWHALTGPIPSPPDIVWNADPLSLDRTTRTLKFRVLPPVAASGSPESSAIKVTMLDLEHPLPAYQPSANPLPKNFTAFDTTSNGTCSNGAHAGHHCDTSADCRLCGGVGANTNRPCASDTDCPGGFCPTSVCSGDARRPCSLASHCTGFGTCGAPITYACGGLAACTAAGEGNGCARWVGKPERFRERQEVVFSPFDYLGARLQCTPYYHDWVTATATESVAVFGAEILPNSRYNVEAYSSSCKGVETGCGSVSAPVVMLTRRHGDVVSAFNPPATTQQPDATDIGQLVAKFKSQAGSPSNSSALIQPNVPDGNSDVGASDIVQGVDAAKQFVYSFGGPCPCPSLAVCGATPCPAGAGTCIGSGAPGLGPESTCIKLCRGGTNAGEQCNNHTHCGGGGVCDKECLGGANVGLGCSSNGDCPGSTCAVVTNNAFCRDKCGRCTP